MAAVLIGVAAFVLLDRAPDRRADAAGARPSTSPPASAASSPPAAVGTSPARPAGHKIVYRMTGSLSKASIHVFHPEGGMSTRTVKLPWSDTYEVESFVVIGVGGSTDAAGGTIGCSISVDGKVVQRRSSEGQFANVSCQYQAPMP
ncbi:MmpS family transport accessory protein [Actinomadura sp. WMMB 499]|uniref:MmpS family transport accessory protein n=1 Tax=Actinomadura sp. WMMB 499 TaxID=1219491 RepID=UPI001243CB3F|nr:MmpS family transport accessory protein [Actinomadura sp. WMMB 499]QFG25067.1 hypothetical protein F7P10_31945 [Actinomadura sp. WMMB 499]